MKKRLIALLLSGAMCFSSTISYAAEANDEKHAPTTQEVQNDTTLEESSEVFTITKTEPKKTGWVSEKEGWYYYDEDGKKVTGWLKLGDTWYYLDGENAVYPGLMVANKRQEINGKEYWFTASGAMRKGWIYSGANYYFADNSGALTEDWAYIDGYWFYFEGSDKAMVNNRRKMINGKEYWFEPGGYMKIGWFKDSGKWYFADSSGALAEGWLYDNGSWFYFDKSDSIAPRAMANNCRKMIDGEEYWFQYGGYMQNDWIPDSGKWYYAKSNGALASGWTEINGSRYYFDAEDKEFPKVMLADGKKTIKGQDYWFAQSGEMHTGWIHDEGEWYYIQEDGSKATEWAWINGCWYYLDPENGKHPNAMVSNCKKTIGGYEFWFTASGAMRTGWYQDDEDWYYIKSNGYKDSGWLQYGGYWYYLDPEKDNKMAKNCKMIIDGYEFRFGSSGAMQTGWYQEGEDWYYIKSNGYKDSSWCQVGDVWYYLDPKNDDKMVKNQWMELGGKWYYFYSNGSMATGWLSLNGEWYYLLSSGAMQTGWISVGGVWYYLYSDGSMAHNTTIDGYKLGPTGALLNYGPISMYNKIAGQSSPTGYIIAVDRNARQVGIYQGTAGNWNNVATWSCTVGAPATPTITGTYYAGDKGYYFVSNEGFTCYYYTQISGAYLFHSVLYRGGSLADGRLGMALSHGCVRLHIDNAQWIYNNIPRHTKIIIY